MAQLPSCFILGQLMISAVTACVASSCMHWQSICHQALTECHHLCSSRLGFCPGLAVTVIQHFVFIHTRSWSLRFTAIFFPAPNVNDYSHHRCACVAIRLTFKCCKHTQTFDNQLHLLGTCVIDFRTNAAGVLVFVNTQLPYLAVQLFAVSFSLYIYISSHPLLASILPRSPISHRQPTPSSSDFLIPLLLPAFLSPCHSRPPVLKPTQIHVLLLHKSHFSVVTRFIEIHSVVPCSLFAYEISSVGLDSDDESHLWLLSIRSSYTHTFSSSLRWLSGDKASFFLIFVCILRAVLPDSVQTPCVHAAANCN